MHRKTSARIHFSLVNLRRRKKGEKKVSRNVDHRLEKKKKKEIDSRYANGIRASIEFSSSVVDHKLK